MKDIDISNLEELDRAFEMAQIAQQAVDTAISGHSVIKFVKRLPVESFSYPAISKSSNPNRPQIIWSMPGRDHERAKKKGCKFHFTMHSDYVSCPSEKKHYARAKKFNCWSLNCPYCLSNTALKIAAEVEPKILAYRYLRIRQGIDDPEPKHWVVSPPQEWAKSIITDVREFERLRNRVISELQECGMDAGAMVFHPWRQKKDKWEQGPHFHIVGYGYINTDLFKIQNEGWLIKLVHSEESIRSVRHTIAYLLTHAGIGLVEKADWEADVAYTFWNQLIPDDDIHEMMILDTNSRYYEKYAAFIDPELTYNKEIIPAEQVKKELKIDMHCSKRFTSKRISDNKQIIPIDPDSVFITGIEYCPSLKPFDIDWVEWTKKAYTRKYFPIRRFGKIAKEELGVVAILSEERTRPCPECGSELCTFHGTSEEPPDVVKYKHKIPIISFTEHVDEMRQLLKETNLDLLHEGEHMKDMVEALPQMFIPDMVLDSNPAERFDQHDPKGA